MKKSINKPEHWQDFETLCKKLFGEIWDCSYKIKKNGRQGQSQAGVDVYAIPKGESECWGIQCKGKDNYTNSNLTNKEIDKEIEKAKNFKPKLKTFVFATTGNKDVNIEEYVRIKDLESRNDGGFEILLYCWEDIVDLIEENRNTFNWYVNEQQFKSQFDFEVKLTGFRNELEINPVYLRTKNIYRLEKPESEMTPVEIAMKNPRINPFLNFNLRPPGVPTHINYCWCKIEVIMENIGTRVIEDWKVLIWFKEGFKELADDYYTNHIRFDINEFKSRTTRYFKEDNLFVYKPKNNEPLVQEDNRFFICHILPEREISEIEIEWKLLARNFSKRGTLKLNNKPKYEDVEKIIEVEAKDLLCEEEIIVTEKIEKIDYES